MSIRSLRCVSTLFFLFTSLIIRAQDTAPQRPADRPTPAMAAYAEIDGPGMALSVNYDRRFSHTIDGLGFRIGAGYNLGTDPTIFTVPVGLNYLAGRRGNFFEVGAGATYMDMQDVSPAHKYAIGQKSFDHPGKFFFANSIIGYRHQPKHGGFNFRAGISPFFGAGAAGALPYLSAGYSF